MLHVDASARAYDITGLGMGSTTPGGGHVEQGEVHVTLQAEGGDLYYYFDKVTGSNLNPGMEIAAGGSAAYQDGMCAKLVEALPPQRVCINRNTDQFIQVRAVGPGACQLRMWVSSDSGA